MSIEDTIKVFKESYLALRKEEEELSKQLTSVFESKISDVKPVIDLMKELKLYFFHPDLPNDIKSSHGIILGRNKRNNAEIYVSDGHIPFLKKVDGYRDEVLDEHAIGYPGFFRMCDLDFAFKGIEHVRGYFPTMLDNLKNSNSEKQQFIKEHRT